MRRKYAILRPVWEEKGAVERRKKKEERRKKKEERSRPV